MEENTQKETIVIAGITRSGLTLTMQMLNAGGFPCFGEHPAFENYEIGQIPWNNVKGMAVKVVDTHTQIPPKGNYRVIRLYRNFSEQVKSQAKMLRLFGIPVSRKERKAIEKSLPADYQRIDNWAMSQNGVLKLSFEAIITHPEFSAKKIKDFVGMELDIEKMKSCVVARDTNCLDGMLELDMI